MRQALNLQNGERVFVINSEQHIVTLGLTSFRSNNDPGKYVAKSFIGDSDESLWVSDPEENEDDFRLKMEYVIEICDSVIVGEQSSPKTTPIDAVNEEVIIAPVVMTTDEEEEDEIQKAINRSIDKVNGQGLQKQHQNENTIPSKNKNKRNRSGSNQNKQSNNTISNNNNNVTKNVIVKALKNEDSFNELYYNESCNFGTQASMEDFSNVLVGKSAIDLAVRFAFTDDVNLLGNIICQGLGNGKSQYAVAYIGYMNPLDKEMNVNYFSLALACQKLNVLFANKTIAIQDPVFDNADKVNKIFENELSSIKEVFVCS